MSQISPYTFGGPAHYTSLGPTNTPGGFSGQSFGTPGLPNGFGFPSYGDPMFYFMPAASSFFINRLLGFANGSAVNINVGPTPSHLGMGDLLLGLPFYRDSGAPSFPGMNNPNGIAFTNPAAGWGTGTGSQGFPPVQGGPLPPANPPLSYPSGGGTPGIGIPLVVIPGAGGCRPHVPQPSCENQNKTPWIGLLFGLLGGHHRPKPSVLDNASSGGSSSSSGSSSTPSTPSTPSTGGSSSSGSSSTSTTPSTPSTSGSSGSSSPSTTPTTPSVLDNASSGGSSSSSGSSSTSTTPSTPSTGGSSSSSGSSSPSTTPSTPSTGGSSSSSESSSTSTTPSTPSTGGSSSSSGSSSPSTTPSTPSTGGSSSSSGSSSPSTTPSTPSTGGSSSGSSTTPTTPTTPSTGGTTPTPSAPSGPPAEEPSTNPPAPSGTSEPQPPAEIESAVLFRRIGNQAWSTELNNRSRSKDAYGQAAQNVKNFFGTNLASMTDKSNGNMTIELFDQSAKELKAFTFGEFMKGAQYYDTTSKTWKSLESQTKASAMPANLQRLVSSNPTIQNSLIGLELQGLAKAPQIRYVDASTSQVYNIGNRYFGHVSPIVLDTDGNGKVDLTSLEDGVQFDIDGDGQKEQVSWTQAKGDKTDGWLALDRNGNGQVDSGKELFGAQHGANNGFDELEKFDDNHDGVINQQDQVYGSLKIWKDQNHDGVSQAHEMESLDKAGVQTVKLGYTESKEEDQFGNQLRQQGRFERTEAKAADIAQQTGVSQDEAKNGLAVDAWVNVAK